MADKKNMSANDRLRHDRLTFYKDDIEKIDQILTEFLRLSGAKCALLIDKEGHLVTKRGEVRTIDMDTIYGVELDLGLFAIERTEDRSSIHRIQDDELRPVPALAD